MEYNKTIQNGLILSVSKGATVGNITEDEYNAILSVINNKPTPPQGFDYKLKENLEWELYELPTPEPEDEDATEEDFKAALNTLGVSTDGEE